MKKLTFCMLATFFMLSVIPAQIKAATESNPASTTAKSEIKPASNSDNNGLSLVKTLDKPVLSSTENKELLREVSPLKNDQDEHSRRYQNRHQRRDVDVTIDANRGRHYGHSGAYIGGGGVLLLILVLILVL